MCDWPAPRGGCSLGCIPRCPTSKISPDPSYYTCPTPCTIVLCSQPVPDILRPKVTCKAYFPSVEPIKSVRFAASACPPSNCSEFTNLAYRPIIQGGIRYCGVDKLTPFIPLPGPPTMCRPMPVRPSDHPSMTVYSAP